MIVKRFSSNQIMGTTAPGFDRHRKYDQDMNRLGRWETQRQLHKVGDLNDEIRQMNKELNEGRKGLWQHTD